MLCCSVVNVNTVFVPLNSVSEKPQCVLSEPWVVLVQVIQIWDQHRLVLNITSLGFSDIGFSPCASRTWPEMKGEKHVKGYGIIKKQTWCLIGPCNLSLLQGKRTFPAALSKSLFYNNVNVIMTGLSYIFGICPTALGRPHFTLSHQPQGQVRKGCQVATSTHCSLLWDEGEAGGCRGKRVTHEIQLYGCQLPQYWSLQEVISSRLNWSWYPRSVKVKWGRWFTVEGLDHGMKGFQRNSAVPFGQNIDPQCEQHAGSFWAQRVSHTYKQ